MATPNFFITSPHSGEKIATECPWLEGLPEPILMCDIDRYVDQLYQPVIEELKIEAIVAEWHRYVVDLNRFPEDHDQASVEGAKEPKGTHPKGLHWSVTTKGHQLISEPMSREIHEKIVEKYYQPFHDQVAAHYEKLLENYKVVFQLDAHSMPSVGEKLHLDPGERRAEIVVSDCEGKSCNKKYVDLVISSYEDAGFQVAYNWPYVGGRITERYGRPEKGQQAIQVELNRALYMNESTKKLKPEDSREVSKKISKAIRKIDQELSNIDSF